MSDNERPIPDHFYSVIVRFVFPKDGGPRHDLINTCEHCGDENPVKNEGARSTILGSDWMASAFAAWMRDHSKVCKVKT